MHGRCVTKTTSIHCDIMATSSTCIKLMSGAKSPCVTGGGLINFGIVLSVKDYHIGGSG